MVDGAELVVDLSTLFTQEDQKDHPQGRSEREAESWIAITRPSIAFVNRPLPRLYGEALNDTRRKRAVFFSILL
ncbi:MAG: hypothetical protein CV081_12935 [Nitrospira sp. LK265]|nr:hypothetical protein [Nitrospira sp. LK265]